MDWMNFIMDELNGCRFGGSNCAPNVIPKIILYISSRCKTQLSYQLSRSLKKKKINYQGLHHIK